MIKPIVKMPALLQRKSADAMPADLPVAQDLRDTLAAHAQECVGMAANMIGVNKRVIVFGDQGTPRVMFNPEIIKKFGPYQTQEGCLSLTGTRPAARYKRITVRFQDESFRNREETFKDFTAQIIQHEIDHTNGILI
jgi:peptide deformylase